MSQARLKHCMLLHALSERTDNLLDTDTAKEFAERNEHGKTTLDIFKVCYLWPSFLAFHFFLYN